MIINEKFIFNSLRHEYFSIAHFPPQKDISYLLYLRQILKFQGTINVN